MPASRTHPPLTLIAININTSNDMVHETIKQQAMTITDAVKESWRVIAPFWPLKNLIAVNPLQGLEHLPFEEAYVEAAAYFQQEAIPEPMAEINRQSIKWLQIFLDEGQATIAMPHRKLGFYQAWLRLAQYDKELYGKDLIKQQWLASQPHTAEQAINACLTELGIAAKEWSQFLTLLLTTLPGWAAYVKYRTEWAALDNHANSVTQVEYLAVRLIITCMLWPEAKKLLEWHALAHQSAAGKNDLVALLTANEQAYRVPLLTQVEAQSIAAPHVPQAQLVFCIDVRSEPFRRALEAQGDYETFGFAGFFGVPVQISAPVTGDSYASCPVLLTPKHCVHELPQGTDDIVMQHSLGHIKLGLYKRLYQSLKYTFTTPFTLVEMLGMSCGLWMALRSFLPALAHKIKTNLTSSIRPPIAVAPSLDNISFAEQCAYAEGALKMMGLTRDFAPFILLCGHGSATQNNAYATALDCGACGGRHGASNARILAMILNTANVRLALANKAIVIPDTTLFIAAEHNTTTDEISIFGAYDLAGLAQLKHDIEAARRRNSQWRCHEMGVKNAAFQSVIKTQTRSKDWAQVRPEWGLARNAAFIVAPRDMTKEIDLQGRAFLHSYDWQQDPDGASLTVILTAPMVVAQWINAQYLFSTLDNVAYGGGSKITKNITGKIGIMQGNASDLMTGLPLQSVYRADDQPYHELQRLMTVVYAPRTRLDHIVAAQAVLQKLFGNGWVTLACIDPENQQSYVLQRDLTWCRDRVLAADPSRCHECNP
jgi:uncharacterized protein YbcC (UPF0753/DUF2309 family)